MNDLKWKRGCFSGQLLCETQFTDKNGRTKNVNFEIIEDEFANTKKWQLSMNYKIKGNFKYKASAKEFAKLICNG